MLSDLSTFLKKSPLIYLFFLIGIPLFALSTQPEASQAFIAFLADGFSQSLEHINDLIFFSIGGIPLIVVWLIAAGLIFTLKMQFINIRGFKHAIEVVFGKYNDSDATGEVSHFQALSTALSATVGLGNIAGVAIAIKLGGAGAVFWMTIAGFLGMSSKFVECTLGQKYRIKQPDGTMAGGPMYYLSLGLTSLGYPKLGKVLATLFCLFAVGGGLGSSSIYQANQSKEGIAHVLPILNQYSAIYGLILAGLVGLVIMGGIRRIAKVASTIVPLMCGIYVLGAFWVIWSHFQAIPQALLTIVSHAFSVDSAMGGIVGVSLIALVQGFRRSAFSCEAGMGIASIAHATAKTKNPIREGIVSLLEPFIDTVVVCNLTALVIILTGVDKDPAFSHLNGASLTSAAFSTVIPWFPYVLAIAGLLFAFSTMISWGYYGQLCFNYLFGANNALIYQVLFLTAIFMGSIANSSVIIRVSDALFMMMAIPNIIGLYYLSGQVKQDLQTYWLELKKSVQ